MESRKTFAKNFAKKIVKQHGLTIPIDVISFCKDILGFNIIFLDDLGVSAIMIRSEKIISVNNSESIHRQRFSIAHEIGHYYLHKNIFEFKEPEDHFKDLVSPMEREANTFAGEFLVPTNELKDQLDNNAKIPDLVKIFNVSDTVIWIRLEELNLI